MVQRLIPGVGWIDETATAQRLIPGVGWVDEQSGAPGTPPAGTVTITSVTPGETTASVVYSYDDTDEDSFEYRLDGGTAAAIGASPATITGLTASTPYDIEVRAINADGDGAWSAVENFTTTTPDTTGPSFGAATLVFVTKTDTTVALTTSAAATDAVGVTGYEWSSDNGATYPFTSLSNSFTFSALTALTSYNFRVRAYDAAGNRSTALTLTTSTYRAGDTGQNIVDNTAAIPGVQEEGFLYNDVVLPADAAKWFSYNITTPVTDTGSLTLYPNGSFIWVGLSADSFYYQLEVDGANVGSPQLVTLDPVGGGAQNLTFTLFTNTNTFEPFTVANETATNLTFTLFTNTQTFYPFTVYRAGDPLPVTGGKQRRLSMKMGLGL